MRTKSKRPDFTACQKCGGAYGKQAGLTICRKCGHQRGAQDLRSPHAYNADEFDYDQRLGYPIGNRTQALRIK